MSYCRVMVPHVPAMGSKVPVYHWSTSCRLISSGWTSRILPCNRLHPFRRIGALDLRNYLADT